VCTVVVPFGTEVDSIRTDTKQDPELAFPFSGLICPTVTDPTSNELAASLDVRSGIKNYIYK
jgi:hypothetical protein